MQGLLSEGKEGKRRLDRKMSDYDAARLKHLGHKSNPKPSKWRKGEDADKIHNDMVAAQVHTMSQLLCNSNYYTASLLLMAHRCMAQGGLYYRLHISHSHIVTPNTAKAAVYVPKTNLEHS